MMPGLSPISLCRPRQGCSLARGARDPGDALQGGSPHKRIIVYV